MIYACDFDGTVVVQDGRRYDDLTTPLRFMPGAREALTAFRRAGHVGLLWSARASRALLVDPELDPLVRAGARQIDRAQWRKSLSLNRARHRQMLDFVARNLPGVFAAVDDGLGGKPSVDLFIDDRCFCVGPGTGWSSLAFAYGADALRGRTPPLDLDTRVADLEIPQPTGRLNMAIEIVHSELRDKGITLEPDYIVGDGDFWVGDRSISVNVPWFLATDQLWDLFADREGYTFDNVLRLLRHELGHVVNYAYELFALGGFERLFGDFTQRYPGDDFKVDPARADEFVQYLDNEVTHYGQKHPDEDFAETFAAWLDPASGWRTAYAGKPVALKKLEWVADRSLDLGVPLTVKRGYRKPYTQVAGTVREALAGAAA